MAHRYVLLSVLFCINNLCITAQKKGIPFYDTVSRLYLLKNENNIYKKYSNGFDKMSTFLLNDKLCFNLKSKKTSTIINEDGKLIYQGKFQVEEIFTYNKMYYGIFTNESKLYGLR